MLFVGLNYKQKQIIETTDFNHVILYKMNN
jgi:hypothetical protein